MNEDVLIDLGAISEETNGTIGQVAESDQPLYED